MGKTKHTAEFKKKVAIEALREQKTINEIAKAHGVYPVQVSLWRKQLLDNSTVIFGGKKEEVRDREDEIAILERKIGQLKMISSKKN